LFNWVIVICTLYCNKFFSSSKKVEVSIETMCNYHIVNFERMEEIALLQAEASACVLGLANVLFGHWVFINLLMLFRSLCMNANGCAMKSW
jgi:hypothetical protein